MRNIVILLMCFCPLIINGQKVQQIQATTQANVTELLFDTNGNRYLCGSVHGRIWIDGKYTDQYAKEKQRVIAKMNDELTFDWLIPINNRIRDAKIIDEVIHVIYLLDDKTEKTKTLSVLLEKYDLNGKKLYSEVIYKCKASMSNSYMLASLTNNGVMVWSSFKGEDSFVEFEGERLKKKEYSVVFLKYFDMNGKVIWNKTFEGGWDAFTSVNLNSIFRTDNQSNLCLIVNYGSSFVTDELKLSNPPLVFEDKGAYVLYPKDHLFLKINSEGKIIQHKIIARNNVDFQDFCFDSDNNIFLSGNYLYNYDHDVKTAKESNEQMPDIKSKTLVADTTFSYPDHMKDAYPSYDGFLLKLDADFNLIWKKSLIGRYTNSFNSILWLNGTLHVAANYAGDVEIDDVKFQIFTTQKSFSDAVYLQFDANGKMLKKFTISGEKTHRAKIYSNANNEPEIVVFASNNTFINGKENKPYGHWGGVYIISP